MIKELEQEIEYNVEQKMRYRDRIYDACVSVSSEKKNELEVDYLQHFIKRNNDIIKEFENANQLLHAKVTALKEVAK